MRYFPLFIDLSDKRVVVIGGGAVAERRVRALLPFGCRITVIAPEATEELAALAEAGELCWVRRTYQAGDCGGSFLVLAATDDRAVNDRAAEEARREGALANVSHDKAGCDFYFPALVTRGEDVVVGITASGADHGLAARLRQAIAQSMEEFEA